MKNVLVLILILTVLSVSCVPRMQTVEPASQVETKQPGEASPAPAEDPAVVYEKSGGFAGISEKWTIFTSGKIVGQQGEAYQVDAERVTQLVDEIQAAGFFELEANYGKFTKCRDCFNYQVQVVRQGQRMTVVSTGTAEEMPKAFTAAVEKIEALLAEAKGGS
jgi:hypothetical protein